MGYGSYTDTAYSSISSARATASTASIFTTSTAAAAAVSKMASLDMTTREACDSAEHPHTVPVIVALDVTGSMGRIPDTLARGDFSKLMGTLVNNGVEDTALLFVAVGDHLSDRVPLQVGQFESGAAEVDQWLTGMYLEGGGGGQSMESYPLAWLVAARKTRTDAWDKRQEKGFLFTIGDEGFHAQYSGDSLQRILGAGWETATAEQLFLEASRRWHIFHIHCSDSYYGIGDGSDGRVNVLTDFKRLLGERCITVPSSMVGETIAVTVGSILGLDRAKMTANMSASTAALVLKAVGTAVSPVDSAALSTRTGVIAF